jgi:hypothetical protein
MAMTPGKPVREDTASAGIAFVLGFCAFVAVIAFFPHAVLAAIGAGTVAAVLGWYMGGIPYRHPHWFKY